MEGCLVGRMGRSRWKLQGDVFYSIWGNARDLKSNKRLCEVVRSRNTGSVWRNTGLLRIQDTLEGTYQVRCGDLSSPLQSWDSTALWDPTTNSKLIIPEGRLALLNKKPLFQWLSLSHKRTTVNSPTLGHWWWPPRRIALWLDWTLIVPFLQH